MLTPDYNNRPERTCVKCKVLFSGERCKACQSKYKKEYIKANRKKINNDNKEWRKEHPEKSAISIKNWQLNNPDRVKEINRRSAIKRRDQRIIDSREWRKQNADRIKKSWQEYRKVNRDQLKEARRKYEEKHPEKIRAGKHTRRTKILGLDSKIDAGYVKFLKIAQGMKCNYCDQAMDKYQIDHIVPIARGGDNKNENLQLLCAPCNRQKGAKTDNEYREYLNVINS